MADDMSVSEKARKIINLLPKENCGKCGFNNCGGFALAVAEGKASPFGCRKDPSAGYEIGKVTGIEATEEAMAYASYSLIARPGIPTSVHTGYGMGPGHHRDKGHGLVYGTGLGNGRHQGRLNWHSRHHVKRHHC